MSADLAVRAGNGITMSSPTGEGAANEPRQAELPEVLKKPVAPTGTARHILATASTMVGISTTLIGFVKLMDNGKDTNYVDEFAAAVAVIFLFSAIFSYASIRVEARKSVAAFCERVADNLFIVGLVGITSAAAFFAYEIL